MNEDSSRYLQTGCAKAPATRFILLMVLAAVVTSGGCDDDDKRAPNRAPVARCGLDQTVLVGTDVLLDGSGSTDTDGDALSYTWELVTAPALSGATVSSTNTVLSSLIVDVAGDYVVELTVSDGTTSSAPDTCTISTANSPPVANAGMDQSVALGALVRLDGAGSFDADNDPLSFDWTIVSAPTGSGAVLDNEAIVNPAFFALVPGIYVVELVVHDSAGASSPDTVRIDTINSPPVADAGPDQDVIAGDTVSLNGSASSDADGDPIGFRWALLTAPTGSGATPANADEPIASFVADIDGAYVAQLVVNDGRLSSAPDTALITAGQAMDDGFGTVYIFNIYSQEVTRFGLNGQGSAGSIAAPDPTAAAPYTPAQLAVRRTNLTQNQLDEPLFVTGVNDISVNYGGQNFTGTVTLPGPPQSPLEDDLWLYLAFEQSFLFLPTGQLLQGGVARLMKVSDGIAAQEKPDE